ncbi:MAG TPA: phosphoglycerate mutase family protein [Gelidibacter sp.]|uniref:SixA phosphatase family protein n=1 Tax=Gelidibacter sp. TaxID=2018083 RepID=UPI002CFF878D|nr:phosphoglycerate mutase family protein [Gelidibacter sp.]HXJ98507.1 phosphoglycerate mutase family protein [Gelidibacter sp.]
MKTIVLIRHAKSSWDENVGDIKRSLSSRGFSDANLVSKAFKTYHFYPDAVYSSPANRALTTCTIFMENLGLPTNKLFVEDVLYDFGGNQVRRFINSLDDHFDKIMIFGHNHAFTSLANSFGDVYIDNLPTSGLAMIDFDNDHWKDLSHGKTRIVLTPKDFK